MGGGALPYLRTTDSPPCPNPVTLLFLCLVFRYVSWSQGDSVLHMITEYTRSTTTGMLTDSGNSITSPQATDPTGLALSPDGAQLYVLSEQYQSVNWYV